MHKLKINDQKCINLYVKLNLETYYKVITTFQVPHCQKGIMQLSKCLISKVKVMFSVLSLPIANQQLVLYGIVRTSKHFQPFALYIPIVAKKGLDEKRKERKDLDLGLACKQETILLYRLNFFFCWKRRWNLTPLCNVRNRVTDISNQGALSQVSSEQFELTS